MTEWPPAPRLKAALEDSAQQANVQNPARQALEDHLSGKDQTGTGDEVQWSAQISKPGASTKGLLVAAAAAVLMVAGLMTAASVSLPDDPPTTIDVITEDRDAPEAETSLPLLQRRNRCGTEIHPARPYHAPVDGQQVEVRALRQLGPGMDEFSIINVSSKPDWSTRAEQHDLKAVDGTVSAIYLATSSLEAAGAAKTLEVVLEASCPAPTYLIATGNADEPVVDAICTGLRRTSFSGYTFVDPGPPPTSCQLAQPTVILTTTGPHPNLDDWARYQNCSNPQSRVEPNGNRITTYETCESTLVHVETTGAGAWTQQINGQHPTAYALSIMSMPQ